LNVDPATKELYQVRFNNDDRSVFSRPLSGDPDEIPRFYDALKKWTTLLKKPENELWIQLTPGRAVVVDNWRVLHGRSSFVGHRRIVGSYHNWDDYRSRVRTLVYGEKKGRIDI
jgi:trimethyllysine dioxygenase